MSMHNAKVSKIISLLRKKKTILPASLHAIAHSSQLVFPAPTERGPPRAGHSAFADI